MSEHVITTREGRTAVLTIDRQKSLNALSRAVLEELGTALDEVMSTDDVGVIVITGAGDKAFVAGADIREMADFTPEQATAHAQAGQALFARVERSPKPVIAAVNGFALGGGCELAMACHIRYASENARFGQPEVKLGLIPGFGGTQRLARLVGRGLALELMLDGGKLLSAARAHEAGLVNAVFPAAELMPEVLALAERIGGMGPLACGWVIESVAQGLELGMPAGYASEAELFGQCFGTADGKEGMQAFLERRDARFTGA